MNYTDNQLTNLAKTNPKELVRLLTSPNADIRLLTSGAEILGGEISDETVVLPVLRMLLKHVNAIVREGAAIGVSSFYIAKKPPQDILDRLKVMANNDPSPTIKEYAKSILEDFENME
jgi:predicted O-methyltransferase YrrM